MVFQGRVEASGEVRNLMVGLLFWKQDSYQRKNRQAWLQLRRGCAINWDQVLAPNHWCQGRHISRHPWGVVGCGMKGFGAQGKGPGWRLTTTRISLQMPFVANRHEINMDGAWSSIQELSSCKPLHSKEEPVQQTSTGIFKRRRKSRETY